MHYSSVHSSYCVRKKRIVRFEKARIWLRTIIKYYFYKYWHGRRWRWRWRRRRRSANIATVYTSIEYIDYTIVPSVPCSRAENVARDDVLDVTVLCSLAACLNNWIWTKINETINMLIHFVLVFFFSSKHQQPTIDWFLFLCLSSLHIVCVSNR